MNYEKLIDELYKNYCEGELYLVRNAIAYSRITKDDLEDYVNKNSSQIKNMFSSIKKNNKEDFEIEEIESVLNDLAIYVNDWLDSKFNIGEHQFILANDLFDFNLNTVDDAFKMFNDYTSKESYEKTIDLLKFFKKNNSLEKVYGNNDWKNLETREILISLKDFHNHYKYFNEVTTDKDNYDDYTIDKSDNADIIDFGFFNSIKNNCDNQFKNFDKYRPCLISKKQISTELNKLIFCKNLLEYINTGLFVDSSGYLDCKMEYREECVLENLKNVYNKNFRLDDFKNKQANVIFNPNICDEFDIDYNNPTKLVGSKSLKTNRGVVVGLLLKNDAEDMYYLMHILIADLTNNFGNYEIQFNILPAGEFDKRIQLIRMDNYSQTQAHKNVGGQKLSTSTHIHLYNHFDLLRGKKNGNFDITHNLEESSTDFDNALNSFVKTLNLNQSLSDEITKKVKAIKNRRLKDLTLQSKETEF